MNQHGMQKNFTNTICRSYAITIASTFQLACSLLTINRKINQSIIEIIARIKIFLALIYLFICKILSI